MTLSLQNDAGGTGTGGVFSDRAFMDLTQIANFDIGIGQNPPVGDLIQVTYKQTLTGIPPDRLNLLVNTDFPGVAGSVDIIVIAVDGTFVRNNNHFVTENAGLTFPVGSSENPTNSVLVIYDTSDNNGNGYSLPGEGGGTVGFPSPVILYHELSHALRDAQNTQLDNSDTGCEANPEEHQAELDENDMRDQLGIGHRDPTKHCTTSGSPGICCIVASVATGSPYSDVINELRTLRDQSLRRLEVGFDFFEHLHYDYYSFSPEVCRLMEGSRDLRKLIASLFVVPLARFLQLFRYYAQDAPNAADLGSRFEAELAGAPELAVLSNDDLARAASALDRAGPTLDGWPPEVLGLAKVLRGQASESPFIRWGLLDPIEIYLAAIAWHLDGVDAEEIGRRLASRLAEWGGGIPLTDVWFRLSRYAISEELRFLGGSLLPSAAARSRFAERLIDHLGRADEIEKVLAGSGYPVQVGHHGR